MTDNATTGGTPSRGRIRAGDDDRDRTVERLRAHHAAGRLNAEEFNERMEAALGARYLDELPPLLADLPGDPADDRRGTHERAAPWHGRERGEPVCAPGPPWRAWPFVPVVPILLAVGVIASIGAVLGGHFPFGLIWVAAFLFFWLRPWGRRGWLRGSGRVRR